MGRETMSVTEFDAAMLDELTKRAVASPRLRQHHNIHTSYADPCQRLLNAIEPGSYLRPYKHSVTPRSKLLVALRGQFAVVLFDDGGNVERVIPFGAGDGVSMGAAVEVSGDCWNSVLSLAHGSVLLEVKAGPFNPDEPNEFPSWAPAAGTPETQEYVRMLEDAARKHFSTGQADNGRTRH
jgi:cupin fold WbuC family metalloprotein